MHIHYHYPRPEPFSPYPPGGQVPDYAKWMKEQLALKQDKLTFDILPVESSLNPVTSGGIYLALAAKASLVNGKVPAEQLPSYVDDVLEFASREAFPNPGESGVLYVAQDQNLVYRWTGTTYVAVVSRIDIDTTVTKLSSNPVASLGIWAAIWGSLAAMPAGYTSLYDWTYDQLDGKLNKSGGTMTGGLTIKNASLSLIPQRMNEGTSVVMRGETVDVTTADPVTHTFNHRTLTWPSATGTLAITADATLTPVYGEWMCNPAKVQHGNPSAPTEIAVAVYKPNGQDVWAVSDLSSAASHSSTYMASQPYDPAATSLTFTLISEFITRTVTATRAIVGYVLGTQSDKQLQPKGDYAPATNIPKTALASDVQASLDKADAAATKADATLTAVYSDWVVSFQLTAAQKEAFRLYGPEEAAENDFALTIRNGTTLYVGNYNAAAGEPSEDGLSLLFEGRDARLGLQPGDTMATRAVTGYTLGTQTNKPLQPAGDYAPATKTVTVTATETMLPSECFPIRYTSEGQTVELSADEVEFSPQFVLRVKGASPVVALATFALPSSGQTISDYSQYPDITFGSRAPTAGVWPAYLREGETYSATYPVVYGNDIEPLAPLASPAFTGTPTAPTPASGDNSKKVATTEFVQGIVPYDLGETVTIDSSSVQTDTTDPNNPIYYAEVMLADRTANIVQIDVAVDELRVTFPAVGSGVVRDFGLTIQVGDGTAALAAPALVVNGAGTDVLLANPDGKMPEVADGTATSGSVTALYFSEVAPSVFLVKGEQMQPITQ